MISVSNDFKNAIKSDNREIYGYVELNYQSNEYELDTIDTPLLADVVLSDGSGLVSNKKLMKKYASLENNYTLLDGSFMVWNENVISDVGIITDDVFEDINDTTIIIENNSDEIPVKGITIYFKENLPFSFNITYTYSDETTLTESIINNTSMIYQKIFIDEVYISEISINVTSVEHPDNRLRIACVDFNISDLYDGDELVSFDVSEEIDLFVESLPINTCTINLNNYPNQDGGNKFDPINPTGIVKYLNDDVTINPYIGVLTKENGIEYVHMGEFFLKDWQSTDDGNITFNGVDCIYKIKSMDIVKESYGFLENRFTSSQINEYLTNLTGFTFKLLTGSMANRLLKNNNLGDWLLARIPFYIGTSDNNEYIFRKIKATRNNIIEMSKIVTDIVETIPRNFLRKDAIFENRQLIKEVKITDISDSETGKFISTRNVIDDSHIMSSEVEYVWYKLDKYTKLSTANFSYTSTQDGKAVIVDRNYYLVFVKFTGSIGETIHITYNGDTFEDDPIKTKVWSTDREGDSIEIDFSNYFDANDSHLESTAQFYLSMSKQYKVTAQTMGDPSLEVGDTISVQTRYNDINDGYKDIIITKQRFTFDGGLQCDIEGEGD